MNAKKLHTIYDRQIDWLVSLNEFHPRRLAACLRESDRVLLATCYFYDRWAEETDSAVAEILGLLQCSDKLREDIDATFERVADSFRVSPAHQDFLFRE